jgi:transposase
MGKGYSLDLRKRVVSYVKNGHSRREAARHFEISESCAVKLMQRVEATGSPAPAQQGRPRGGGKLAPHRDFLIERIKARNDITMPELAEVLMKERGVEADPSSLSRMLCRAGFSYKKSADGLGARSRRRR